MELKEWFGPFLEIIGHENVAYLIEGCSKMGVPGIHGTHGIHRNSPRQSSGIEPPPAIRNLPSTRAGGRDDVSSINRLPQNTNKHLVSTHVFFTNNHLFGIEARDFIKIYIFFSIFNDFRQILLKVLFYIWKLSQDDSGSLQNIFKSQYKRYYNA